MNPNESVEEIPILVEEDEEDMDPILWRID